MEFTIPSRHSPALLMEKLKEGADIEDLISWRLWGGKPFEIALKGSKFRLSKRIYYRNSFIPYFYGEIQPKGSGSKIEGKFGMHLFVYIFMTLWFCLTGFMAGVALWDHFTKGSPLRTGPTGFNSFLGIPFGVFLVFFGKALACNHKPAMLEYLRSCAK